MKLRKDIGTWLSMPKVRTWLFMVVFLLFCGGVFAQNNGLTPTADRGRLMPSKALRKSIGTLKLLITDATSEVKYWNKDTVFTNFWKINVDSLINNYNDTTNKSGTPCVDSLWKVVNTIYHRANDCGVQTVTVEPLCTDSVWKVSTTIYHRSITCQVEFWESGEGCSGGDVYYTSSLGDTLGLDPVPECGDVLVVTQDTCRKYVYSRGATPVKWNFIGAFLDNENCFDFPVCVDSFWRAGNLIYHRNIDCIVQSVVDSNTLGYSFRQDGTGVPVLKDTLGRIIKYHAVKGAGNITVAKVGDDIVVSDSTGIGYIFTNVGSYAFVLKDTLDRNIKFRSIRGLGCIKAVVNGNNIEITDTCAIASDYLFTNVGGQKEVLKDTLNRLIKYRTFQGIGGVKVTQLTNTITIEDTTNVSDYRFTNVGTGKWVLKDTLSRLIKYRTLLGAGTVKVTEGTNEITIQDTISNVLNTAGLTGGGGIGYFKTSLSPIPTGGSIRLSAGNNIKITETTPGLDGVYIIEALPSTDSIWTATSSATTFNFNHRPDQTSDVTITAGTGIKFDNNAAGRNGTFRINADTSSVIFDGIANQLVFANSTGANNANLSLTPQTGTSKVNLVGAGIITTSSSAGTNGTITITGTEVDGDSLNEIQTLNTLTSNSTTFKVELKKDASTNFQLTAGIGTYFDNFETGATGKTRINIDTTNSIFNGYNYDVINIGTGAEIYRTTTGSDPKTFNLRKINAGGGVTVTQNVNDITISADSIGVCVEESVAPPTALQAVVTGDGTTGNCLAINTCGWILTNVTDDAYDLMYQPVGGYGCLKLCPALVDCLALFQSIDDPNKLASVTSKSDKNGLFVALIDVINRQNARIAQLETPQIIASTSAIMANNVSQNKLIATINTQAKLIEELTARLDRLDRLQASK